MGWTKTFSMFFEFLWKVSLETRSLTQTGPSAHLVAKDDLEFLFSCLPSAGVYGVRIELTAPCMPKRTLYQLSLIFALPPNKAFFVKKPYTRFKISDLVLGNTSWKIPLPSPLLWICHPKISQRVEEKGSVLRTIIFFWFLDKHRQRVPMGQWLVWD